MVDKLFVMSLDEDTANDIFEEIINYLFISLRVNNAILKNKVYVCSSNKAIIGYFRVGVILNGKTYKVLSTIGHYKDDFSHQTIRKIGKYRYCYALKLEDITSFDKQLPTFYIKQIDDSIDFNRFINVIDESSPVYHIIKDWDEAFSLDGHICDDSMDMCNLILNNGRARTLAKPSL